MTGYDGPTCLAHPGRVRRPGQDLRRRHLRPREPARLRELLRRRRRRRSACGRPACSRASTSSPRTTSPSRRHFADTRGARPRLLHALPRAAAAERRPAAGRRPPLLGDAGGAEDVARDPALHGQGEAAGVAAGARRRQGDHRARGGPGTRSSAGCATRAPIRATPRRPTRPSTRRCRLTDPAGRPAARRHHRASISPRSMGPSCTQMLADYGADVIKIERPGAGDLSRSAFPDPAGPDNPIFLSLNRNKRSLSVDTRSEEGKDVIRRLVRDADVVVNNFRAGVMERIGFGYEALQGDQPAPHLGVGHRLRRHGPVQPQGRPGRARAGLHRRDVAARVRGASRCRSTRPRCATTRPACTWCRASCSRCWRATARARARRSTSRCTTRCCTCRCRRRACSSTAATRSTGRRCRCRASSRPRTARSAWSAPSRRTRCATSARRSTCGGPVAAAGVRHQGVAGRAPAALQAIFRERFATNTTDHWVTALEAVDMLCAPVRTLAEALEDEQTVVNRMVVEMEHPTAGTVRALDAPIHLSRPRRRCATRRRAWASTTPRCSVTTASPTTRWPR